MKILPQVTVPLMAEEFRMTSATARALNHVTSILILEEGRGKKRHKVYVYPEYVEILGEGAEPFSTGGSK